MKKKFLFLLVAFLLCFTSLGQVEADTSRIQINVENTLEVPIYKTFTFSLDKTFFKEADNFYLLDGAIRLPLSVVREQDKITFKSVISLAANEKKVLALEYGDLPPNYTLLYIPEFFGTKFICPTSGRVFIASYSNDNHVTVRDTKSKNVVFNGTFGLLENKILTLKDKTIYEIDSSGPIFAEFSNLTAPFTTNSSDDISSVFGTYFELYIPKMVFITSTEQAHVKILNSDGTIFVEKDITPSSFYANTSLKEGIYTISSDKPVLIEYGSVDDNVFSILYGVNKANVISFGGIGVSALFSDTQVKMNFNGKSEEFSLKSPNDFKYFDVLTSEDYKSSKPAFTSVQIEFSKPVLIYTYSQYGNVDGEQIPGLSNNTKFYFRTGKVVKIYGERNRRVFVVPTVSNTTLKINSGADSKVDAYSSNEFLFNESFSSVAVNASLSVAVFDLGIEDNTEILTTLLPIDSYKVYNVSPVTTGSDNNTTKPTTPTETPQQGGGTNSLGLFFKNIFDSVKSYLTKFFSSVSGFFVKIFNQESIAEFFNSVQDFFKGLSLKILDLLRPLSQQVYPFLLNYIPNITVDMISSIIFGVIVLLVIILIIVLLTSRRRKKKEIPVVSVEEIKKKPIVFDVKDLEVKDQSLTEEGTPSTGTAVAELVKTIPMEKEAPPAQEETKPLGRPYGVFPRRRPTEKIEKEESKTEEKRQDVPKEIVQKKEIAEEEQIITGEVTPEVLKQKIEEVKPEEKIEEVKPEEKIEEVKPEEKIEEVKPEESATIEEKINLSKLVEEEPAEQVVEKPIKEKPEENPNIKEIETKEVTYETPIEEPIGLTNEPSFVDFAQPRISEEELGEEQEEIKEEVKPAKEEQKPKEERTEEYTSTFKELLKKLEEENLEKAKKEEVVKQQETKNISEGVPHKEARFQQQSEKQETKVELTKKFVIDASSLRKIYDSNLSTEKKSDLISKACISASEKSNIRDIVEGKYKVTVIALSQIEERLAEDVSRRIGGKITTGEAVIIAKKIRLTDVVVDDDPKLKIHQGVNIISIDQVI